LRSGSRKDVCTRQTWVSANRLITASLVRLGKRRASAYEVRSAFPSRAYLDPEETLRSAGLVPNAAVFLR